MGGSDISGIEDLLALEERLRGALPRAAALALPELLKVAHAEWAAGEAPSGAAWDPLKAGGGVPLTAPTAAITGHVDGATVVLSTPDLLKYHQGGFNHPTGSLGDSLREAQAAARNAQAVANKDRLKRARGRMRAIKKEIHATIARTAARPILPTKRTGIPVSWGDVLRKALERALGDT